MIIGASIGKRTLIGAGFLFFLIFLLQAMAFAVSAEESALLPRNVDLQRSESEQAHDLLLTIPPLSAPRPSSFQTGSSLNICTLLADGYPRAYTIQKGEGERGRVKSQGTSAGFIQVVACIHRHLADEELDRFVGQGWEASVFSTEMDGRLFHRVLVGPFASFKEAKTIQEYAYRCSLALEYIQRIMKAARIELQEGAKDAWRIRVGVFADAKRAAELLEEFGWPILNAADQTLDAGPFPGEQSAEAYRARAAGGRGWGPVLHGGD